MTVRELKRRVDAREMIDWMAYWNMNPWGEDRADLRAGIIAATTANVWAGKGRQAKPSDYMPKFGQDDNEAKQEPSDMKAKFKRAAFAFNRKKSEQLTSQSKQSAN